jgi:hypothetical protein
MKADAFGLSCANTQASGGFDTTHAGVTRDCAAAERADPPFPAPGALKPHEPNPVAAKRSKQCWSGVYLLTHACAVRVRILCIGSAVMPW